MSVNCRMIMEAMEKLAPARLAESWDSIGLQVGSPAKTVGTVLVALDLSDATLEEAVAQNADLLITHHPAIFKPLRVLRTDAPQGRRFQTLLKHDIALFAAHTNLDSADGGVNDVLARLLGLHSVRILRASSDEKLVKLTVFVPESHLADIREAITVAGAGYIGKYSHCTFHVSGTGTFLPLAGASPYIGQQGKLEFVPEARLETIMPETLIKTVVASMLAAHPYEEVAYDLYPLHNQGAVSGLGRIGELAASTRLESFAIQVKAILGAGHVRVIGDMAKPVSRVAVCGGSGADLIGDALRQGADVLVTGDIKYHEAQEALSEGIAVIDAGHFFTEKPVIEAVVHYLRQYMSEKNWDVRVLASTKETDIFCML